MQRQNRNNAYYSWVVVCPQRVTIGGNEVEVLDMSLAAEFLKYEKEDGTIAYRTMREHEVFGGYQFPRSEDGRYITMFVEFSDLDNEPDSFKALLTTDGVLLAGKDMTQVADNLCWYLTLHQYINLFLPVQKIFTTVADALEE
jgi:hypothetical protein